MPEKRPQQLNLVSPNMGKGDKMYYVTVDMNVDTPRGWFDMGMFQFRFYGKLATNPKVVRQFRDEVYMALNDLIEKLEQDIKDG